MTGSLGQIFVLPRPPRAAVIEAVTRYLNTLVSVLSSELNRMREAIDGRLSLEGSFRMAAPVRLKSSTVANLSDFPAADWTASVLYVSDETGGATLAFSDGTNWRRAQDRAIVS